MIDQTTVRTVQRHLRRWNGSKLIWDLRDYHGIVKEIRTALRQQGSLTLPEITARARRLKDDVCSGKEQASVRIPLFALAIEAIRQTLHLDPFDEQLICGIVLDEGKCAQMNTGEGKTLAAVFAAALNALSGKGVHVLTFNDYLARRDSEWMRPVYTALGLSTGFVQEGMSITERQDAYRQDITYLTAKEAGFDYLRDNSRFATMHIVQREFHFAIVDEADSILIDEARIPMVIAAAVGKRDKHLLVYTRLAREMVRDVHFTFDAYGRRILLTDKGIDFAEEQLQCGGFYTTENAGTISHLYNALHAEYLLHTDIDYLVRNGNIELIDELTGRVAENRRWPAGLHAAVEAKENCPVQPSGWERSSIAMHHFIMLYPKVAGITATAEAAEEELHEWYGLTTVIIHPHRSCIRKDLPDLVFRTGEDKNRAVIAEISRVHATGRPILVGTRTVRESEALAGMLANAGIVCRVLNAANDAQEAAIIAEAGSRGAVTISTNMAGRGTDIKLGGSMLGEYAAVAGLGGLYVIGTNRFESRRVDDQLRGRAGRQGDPGSSRFFISLEDALFVKYRLGDLIPPRFITADADGCIDNVYVNNEINRLQRIIEGQHGDIKLTLGKYAAILEQQRQIIARYRFEVLTGQQPPEPLYRTVVATCAGVIHSIGERALLCRWRKILLESIDREWSSYLADMADIRDGIHFRRFGRQEPLHEYNRMAIERFASVIGDAEASFCKELADMTADGASNHLHAYNDSTAPSATWTYMVSDNPFEHDPDLQTSGNIGYSVFAGLLWPVTIFMLMMKKRKKRTDGY